MYRGILISLVTFYKTTSLFFRKDLISIIFSYDDGWEFLPRLQTVVYKKNKKRTNTSTNQVLQVFRTCRCGRITIIHLRSAIYLDDQIFGGSISRDMSPTNAPNNTDWRSIQVRPASCFEPSRDLCNVAVKSMFTSEICRQLALAAVIFVGDMKHP